MTLLERALSGRGWRLRPFDAELALALSQRLGLPEVVGRVLAARGVDFDRAEAFLEPRLRDWLPDPSHLLDLDVAAARLARAVRAREPVGILGDYDVDGACAAALLARYLRALGCPAAIAVPDRLSEGYGPSAGPLARLAGQGCRLIVTVDSGTTAFEPLRAARAKGLEVIVVDHHGADADLPEALAVINPNRRDQDGPLGDLAAVGVVFVLLVAVSRELRLGGHLEGDPPDLLQWLDLVALGTVCDVVPLTGLNRAFVAQGLRLLARTANPGLVALGREAGLREAPGAYHLGFVLGPRINAGGRIGESDLGARLLSCDDGETAAELALRLDRLNSERRTLEQRILEEAAVRVAPDLEAGAPLLLTAGPGWHPGVLGIVAARLVERHHRPAIVLGLEDGIGRGSGRSIQGFDLGAAVLAARRQGLLLEGGGHAMAAGLTLRSEGLARLRGFLGERLEAIFGAGPPPRPPLLLDGVLSVGGARLELARALARLSPFGPGNPEPRFVLTDARVVHARVVGQDHVACVLAGAASGRLRGIAFRSLGTPLGAALLEGDGAPMRLAGRLREDRGAPRPEASFEIEDAAP